VLTRCKKHIARVAKKMNATIIRRLGTKTLKRNTILEGRGRLHVNKISGGRNSLGPKVRWDGGSNHKSMSSLRNMMMLALSNPILNDH
jgi:hypothetical protein